VNSHNPATLLATRAFFTVVSGGYRYRTKIPQLRIFAAHTQCGAAATEVKAPASRTHSKRFATFDSCPDFGERLECAELAPAFRT